MKNFPKKLASLPIITPEINPLFSNIEGHRSHIKEAHQQVLYLWKSNNLSSQEEINALLCRKKMFLSRLRKQFLKHTKNLSNPNKIWNKCHIIMKSFKQNSKNQQKFIIVESRLQLINKQIFFNNHLNFKISYYQKFNLKR